MVALRVVGRDVAAVPRGRGHDRRRRSGHEFGGALFQVEIGLALGVDAAAAVVVVHGRVGHGEPNLGEAAVEGEPPEAGAEAEAAAAAKHAHAGPGAHVSIQVLLLCDARLPAVGDGGDRRGSNFGFDGRRGVGRHHHGHVHRADDALGCLGEEEEEDDGGERNHRGHGGEDADDHVAGPRDPGIGRVILSSERILYFCGRQWKGRREGGWSQPGREEQCQTDTERRISKHHHMIIVIIEFKQQLRVDHDR